MTFWSDKIVEPKRKFRWLLSINGIPYWTIKKVNRPTFEIDVQKRFFSRFFIFRKKNLGVLSAS